MASNPTPENDAIALALAEELADGCQALEVTLGIKQNTEAAIRAAINAALQAYQNHAGAALVVNQKYGLLQEKDTAGTVTLTNCKLRLAKLFGQRASAEWTAAGWPPGKMGIPDSQDGRATLLNKLKIYFTSNPASESADMEATAALCEAAHTALSNARSVVNTAESNLTDKLALRNAAMKALRKRIRGLIDELGQLIAEDDPRWETFGLNIPANPSAPLGITNLTLSAPGGGKIHCLWTYAPRMNGTRLLTKRQGIDLDWVNAGTADGLEKTLEGFTPGQVVDVQAVPYNDGGDGPPSPVRTVTVQ